MHPCDETSLRGAIEAASLDLSIRCSNIFPDLDAKRDIVQNAIDLFSGVGLGKPRVSFPV